MAGKKVLAQENDNTNYTIAALVDTEEPFITELERSIEEFKL